MRTDRYLEENRIQTKHNQHNKHSKHEMQRKPKMKKRRALKLLLLFIFLLLVAIPATLYYSYKSTLDSLAVSFSDSSPTVEIGEDHASMDYIEDSVGEIEASSEYLDTETAGDKVLVFTASKSMFGGLLNPFKRFRFKYTVKDRTPPIMLWSGDGVTLEKGTEFDIKNVIGYGDNADPKPEVSCEGNVDMNTVGSYPLHVTVTDASGNSTDWQMTVNVAEELPTYQSSSSRFEFSDFKKTYAGDGKSFGIDVSDWQGDIDFEKVKSAGCEFVIIRIGWSEDGSVSMDKKFRQNLERAKAAGIPIGLYLYSYDNSVEDVKKAASWIVKQLGGTALELPIAFDWEDFGQFQHYEMSFITLNKMYDAFAGELKKAGYECMLYGSLNFLEKVWEDTDKRPVWLAHYAEQTDYKGPHRIWQASNTGKIDGISGAVDLDIMYE